MAVIREHSEVFHSPSSKVAKAIRRALADGQPSYGFNNIVEADEGLTFHAVVTPISPWLLSTKMAIRLDPGNSQTRVIVQTRSQWFILGDILNCYGGYIRDIFLQTRLRILESSQERLNE